MQAGGHVRGDGHPRRPIWDNFLGTRKAGLCCSGAPEVGPPSSGRAAVVEMCGQRVRLMFERMPGEAAAPDSRPPRARTTYRERAEPTSRAPRRRTRQRASPSVSVRANLFEDAAGG